MTTEDVRALYERRPYPHYPLLAKPQWQDGFLGASAWAGLVAKSIRHPADTRHVLSVGCGEMLPYIIRNWEANSTHVTCVDLSQRSLRRAAFRCAFLSGKLQLIRGDINELLMSGTLATQTFDHIEAYGVLHHISTLDKTLEHLQKHLAPTGTMRIMVYNARARNWIWHANRAFRLLGLSHNNDNDIITARTVLFQLAQQSPRLKERLQQMGTRSLENSSRFADTFLHPWESRLDIADWLDLFQQKQLRPVALFDRYAELDDLENPLWKMPTSQQLTERAEDLRFENNLELWLTRMDAPIVHAKEKSAPASIPLRIQMRMPPLSWLRFPETNSLSFMERLTLWQGWIKGIHYEQHHASVALIQKLPLATAQRLARIGAITHTQALHAGLEKELQRPIHATMEAPTLPSVDILKPQAEQIVDAVFANATASYREQAVLRFLKACQ